jgi:ABC-type polysaccharide/polyol phosphate export permease
MSVASEAAKAYRVVWLIVCAAFGVVGVSVAFHAAPYNLVVLSVECGVAAGVWSLLVVRFRDSSRRSRVRFVLLVGLAGAAAGGAFVGFASCSGQA